MKIEIWSDYACPYCYIGKRKLEKALEDFPEIKDCVIVFKSFELDPDADFTATSDTKERLMKKYAKSDVQAQEMIDSITEYARHTGFEIHYDTARYTNTFDAHRIAKYALSKGKEISERLLHAYFIENKELSDFSVLTEIAVEAGLVREEVEKLLKSDDFATEVRRDEAAAQTMGIRSVPFFVIEGKHAISGAQEVEVFKKALTKVLAAKEDGQG